MQKNNLAYKSDTYYNDIPDSPLIVNRTKVRSAGGVMVKAGKDKRLKVSASGGHVATGKRHISKGTAVAVVVLAAMAFLVLFRGLAIQKGYDNLEIKKAEYSAIDAENKKIQSKINATLDLKNVENIAKNTYNMGEPTKAQIVYINLEQEEEVKKTVEKKTFFGAVGDFFEGIVAYFS